MSEIYRVIVIDRPEIRELSFEFEPRVGERVRLPDLDGDLHLQVVQVVHSARLPHSNDVASVLIIIHPERPPKSSRT